MTIAIGWDTSTNRDLLKKLLRKVFDSSDHGALVEHAQMFKVIPVSDEYEREARMAGFEGQEQLTDGQEIPLADPTFDDIKDWRQERFGLGYKITSGMKKFNRWDLMEKFTRLLKVAVLEETDIDIFGLWNSPTGTTITGFDGLALASNSHTCLDDDATTYDNYLDADLGYSSLDSAIAYFDTLVDDMGRITPAIPTKLYVNPQLRREARELLGSTKVPYKADNTLNYFLDWDITAFTAHRITAATAWGLLAFKDKNYDIKVFVSQKPDMKVQDAPDLSRSTIVTSEQWYKKGFGDPRMAFIGNT